MIREAEISDVPFIVKIINDHPQGIAPKTVVDEYWVAQHIVHDWYVNLIHNDTGFIQYARFLDGIYNIHPFCYKNGTQAFEESIEYMRSKYDDFKHIVGFVAESNMPVIRWMVKNKFTIKAIIGDSLHVLERSV